MTVQGEPDVPAGLKWKLPLLPYWSAHVPERVAMLIDALLGMEMPSGRMTVSAIETVPFGLT